MLALTGLLLAVGWKFRWRLTGYLSPPHQKQNWAFPEINLGIMPGYGGTGRAYRPHWHQSRLDMMVTGRPVGSKDAIASGLADEMVDSADDLAVAMRAWLLSCNGAKPALSQRETEPMPTPLPRHATAI